MKYFENCATLDDLKKAYRSAAMKHHPDVGGDLKTMQAINAEYDRLFPLFKLAYNQTAVEPTHETAESTRNEFYTQNGWKGSRYNSDMSTKDISIKIREYVKTAYPDCKFSVTTHYASMCSEIRVSLMSGPYEALKDGQTYHSVNQYHVERDPLLTDWAKAVLSDVNDCIKSYHWDDSDSQIDYFDVNFYYDLGVGKWDKPYTVKAAPNRLPQPEPASPSSGSIVVKINQDFNGIEVFFPARPAQNVRDALKVHGWRWHGKKQCWYNKNTEENLSILRSITEAPGA